MALCSIGWERELGEWRFTDACGCGRLSVNFLFCEGEAVTIDIGGCDFGGSSDSNKSFCTTGGFLCKRIFRYCKNAGLDCIVLKNSRDDIFVQTYKNKGCCFFVISVDGVGVKFFEWCRPLHPNLKAFLKTTNGVGERFSQCSTFDVSTNFFIQRRSLRRGPIEVVFIHVYVHQVGKVGLELTWERI